MENQQLATIENSKLHYAILFDQLHRQFIGAIYKDNPDTWREEFDKFYHAPNLEVSLYSARINAMGVRRIAYKDWYLELRPSSLGLPTYCDSDIITYCATWLNHAARLKMEGCKSPFVRFKINDFMAFAKRDKNGRRADEIVESLERLVGSKIVTNIHPDFMEGKGEGEEEVLTFGYINAYSTQRNGNGVITDVIIEMNPRFHQIALEFNNSEGVLVLDHRYFDLTLFQRAIYSVFVTFCSYEDNATTPYIFTTKELWMRTGKQQEFRHFKNSLMKIQGNLANYWFSVDEQQDNVLCMAPEDGHTSMDYLK